jgi:hypothetical protein
VPPSPRPRLAVLIDAEGIPARLSDEIFEAVATHGEPIVRRIFGDFSSPRLAGWQRALARHALTAQQQFTIASNGGAAGIALAIDAMDLLHARAVDGFCLASAGTDFTRLATRIREQGLDVLGFGGPAAPESFREACRAFEVLEVAAGEVHMTVAADPAPLRQAATQLLRRAILKVPARDGWRHLSPLGKALRDISPNFDVKHFGHGKLLDLVADTGAFELSRREGRVVVRPRES